MEVSCALCECLSPPIERWRRNVVFLHLSAARNYVEHATCASYSWTVPSPDQWSQDWFSGVDSLFSCNRISKCPLLSCRRAFRVVVIVNIAVAFNRLSVPLNSIWNFNAVRNDFEHAACVLRAHRILEPPPRPINACISCRLTPSTSQCHSQCLLMKYWCAFRVVVIVKAMVVINCSTGSH